MISLRQVTNAARALMDQIERSARFRSKRDKSKYSAEYYCFVAAAIHALLPPDRQKTVTLGMFGDIVSCQDAGRTAS